jgi:hypothetical protein
MEFSGRVEKGVVILDGPCLPPEGAHVTVLYQGSTEKKRAEKGQRVQVPLVRTGQPGTVDLSNARIEEILNEQDVSP